MKNRFVCFLLLAGLLALGFSAIAQTPPGPPQPTLGALFEESAIPLANIDTLPPLGIGADVMAAIQAGALEIRQWVQYDPATSTLQVTGFVVAPGSPLPTPVSGQALSVIWSYYAKVSQVQISVKPRKSVGFVAVVTGAAMSPFGDLVGTPVYVSASYAVPADGGAVTQFAMLSTNIAGTASLHSASGAGSAAIYLPSAYTVPPIAIAGPKGAQKTSAPFQLDGTQSCDPTGGAITYRWVFVPVQGQTVTLTGELTATPGVVLPDSAYGDYTFVLMVTNSAGLSSTDTVTVSYVAPDPPPDPDPQP